MMNTRPTPPHRRFMARSRAFTIIELVVAMAIASIMIFLINRIFFDTTNAVSRGVGLSQIIGESRAFSSTLATDTIAGGNPLIFPPSDSNPERGFLFIGFKTYNNIDFANPRRLNGSAIQRDVQSDQLLTVINLTGQNRTPLTPANDNTFSPHTPAAQHAMLWYGHVARLAPNGANAGGLTGGNNRFGHQWIVGRQLMFLEDPTSLTGVAHAQGPFSRNTVVNYGDLATSPIPAAQRVRYMGLSDILNVRLSDDANSPAALLTSAPEAATAIGYAAMVSRMAYVTERLRVAGNVSHASGQLFESWNMAQTHTAFMSNCSDFEIAFAGDFDADGDIDTDNDAGTYIGGNIKWYGYPANDPTIAGYNDSKPTVYEPNPAIPAASGTNFNGTTAGDPIFVGDAALLAEINTQIAPDSITSVQVDRAIIFKHDATDKATQWPHLIRIRYRLHDERGEIESTNGLNRAQGIWFEQIIRVQ